MACSDKWKIDKIDKIFVCLILILICLFEFCSTFVFADDTLQVQIVPNIVITRNFNYFTSLDSASVGYIQMQKGYVYHITFDSSGTGSRMLAISPDVPSLYGTYSFLSSLEPGETFSYACTQDEYLYLDFSWYNPKVTITSEKIPGIDNAITDLVDNVGITNLWSIFENTTSFVLVVVVVSIGLFIILSLIKKGSKGKSGF